MKAVFLRAGVMAVSLALAGCASTGGSSGTEVTRFHLNQPIARGPIAIEAADPQDDGSLEFQTYSGAIARQLQQLGWTVADRRTRPEQVAVVSVLRGSRQEMRTRPPVTIGLGGGTGGWSGGVGGGVSFGVGGKGGGEVVGTRLEVRIRRPSDGTVFWEGRAETEAPASSPDADGAIAVERLAQALFLDFPGESGRTIRLR